MAKPTGTSGFLRVGIDSQGRPFASFEKLPFSNAKAVIEMQVATRFVNSLNGFPLSNPIQNGENDFDMTVSTPAGPAYLELMEIAPLKGPYEQASPQMRPYELGAGVLSGIVTKSGHYGSAIGRDLYLLLYSTHWTFALDEV